MNVEDPKVVDVAIVGFGPTGATLASLLGREGLTTVVVEREPEIHTLPRAVHFDHEVMRTFQALGLARKILPITGPVRGYEFRNARGQLLMSIDVQGQIASQGWRPDYMFHQPSLERVLRDAAVGRESVSVRLGRELVGLDEDDRGVTLTLRDVANGSTRTLRARYVVGCDGSASPTREIAGLEIEDLAFDEPWLVVDATVEGSVAELSLPEMPLQLCDPQRPTTFIPVAGPYIRWEFMLLPGEGEEMKDRVRELVAAWVDPDAIRVIRSAVYRFHALIGERWRTRRVLLAGDAVHQMPPFLGQGMCAGMRDAANLSWKLGLALRGESDALLDTYQQERAPHVRQVIGIAIDMGRIICTLDPQVAAARDAQMIGGAERPGSGGAMRLPDLQQGFLAPEPRHSLTGSLGLQAQVRGVDGSEALLDDHVGPGFALLWNGPAAPLSEKARSALARLGARQVSILAPGGAVENLPGGADVVVEDVEGSYERWFHTNDAAAVLVRPDFAVYGATAEAKEMSAMLEAIVYRLVAD